MASPNVYPRSLAPSGPDILVNDGGYFVGSVLWVNSVTGSDANAGTEPELPKATWVSAYSVAAAGDLILLAASHDETVSVAQTLNTANVATVGMGIGTAKAKLRSTVAGVTITPNVAGLQFHNLYFPASTAATTARLSVAAGGTDCIIRDCDFECGAQDTTSTVTIAGARTYVRGCTFTATASRPGRAILVSGAVASCIYEDILIDGSSYGWVSPAFGITAAATLMTLENVRLANKSDFVVTSTGTSYRGFGVRSIDNTGSRIVIAA